MHGGRFSLVETGDGAGSVYVDVTGLQPGTEYLISAWTAAQPGAKAAAQLAVYDSQLNVATFSQPVIPDTHWQQITHKIKVNSSNFIRIHLFHLQGSGTIYWDDVQVVPAT